MSEPFPDLPDTSAEVEAELQSIGEIEQDIYLLNAVMLATQ